MGQFDNVLVDKLRLDSSISAKFASTSSNKPEVSADERKKTFASLQLPGLLNGSQLAFGAQSHANGNKGSEVGAGFMA